ncbi:MAG: AAA family ATPase [Pseudomonadota bacterium]
MLSKFKVKNFKNFKEELVFDLGDTKNYEFNSECVNNNIVKKALIYGRNGTGKSNLGYALFDLISHLSNKNSGSGEYQHYLNAWSDNPLAEFVYEFQYEDNFMIYKYGKIDHETLIYENLSINGCECLAIDRRASTEAIFGFEGTEHLKTDLKDSKISLVNYIKNNAVLAQNETTDCFFKFVKFVEGMLFFRSLHTNNFIGLEQGAARILPDIITRGNVPDFEAFLNEAGVDCKIDVIDDGKESGLGFVFDDNIIPFYEIASTGTRSLTLFYFWLQRMRENDAVSFVFIDEYDAFYHHELSDFLISKLKELKQQVILTTHNTTIMSSDILRPDCNFIMTDISISPISSLTQKELRSSHNIEKMYRAGSFK